MLKKMVTLGISSFLGAVVGNLVSHLLRAYRDAQRVRERRLPQTDVVRAAWVPQSTLAATVLASRVEERPGWVGFLLAVALTLIAVPASR